MREPKSGSGRRWTRLGVALGLGLGLFVLLSVGVGRTGRGRVAGLVQERVAPGRLSGTVLVADARIEALMSQITTGTVVADERALTGEEDVVVAGQPYAIATRHSFSGEPISMATRYAYERFQAAGLDVAFYPFTYAGHRLRNVVAQWPGLRRPDRVYLITAHLDDLPAGPIAPGADDNASGSTAVLVAAQQLRQLDFDCTLRFALFTGEEQGLRGSQAYVGTLAAAGEDVQGVLNLDMIGYNSDADPIVDLHARSSVAGSLGIAETFSQVVAAYDVDLMPEIIVDNPLGSRSDNGSFWLFGYPAILAIEDYDDFNPYYHQAGDRLDALNLDYLTQFTRAGIGTLAHMGCLARTGGLTGTVTDRATGLPLSATVTVVAPARVYTANTDAAGAYSLTLPVYTFSARADRVGYQPVATQVAVFTDTTTALHFALPPASFQLFMPTLLK